MSTLTSQNPYTGEINTTVETMTNEQLTTIIEKAHHAYLGRKEISYEERGALFYKMADLIEKNHEEIGRLTTIEM
jgi:acyl-CoA reductase-like NAD-dependent aldehyde dehydrogenase